ncbi:MAG: hypothetical protein E7576_08020 [Ruminococcaceae bacterium]|nr:hypothetical protein [Oscillospiraceae bacterium]
MAEKPILFGTEMVCAILDGRKTQTRRVIKPQPSDGKKPMVDPFYGTYGYERADEKRTPYAIDDILWVRETWKNATGDPAGGGYALFDTYIYKADGQAKVDYPTDEMLVEDRWRPSIFMPKSAARIFLRVKNVWVERLQDIDAIDCVAEGCDADMLSGVGPEFTRGVFNGIWDSTIKEKDFPFYSWDANPWVWVLSFERIQ